MYKGKKGFFLGWQDRGGRVIRRPGNTSIRTLMSEGDFISAVLDFLGKTGVGNIKEGVVVGARAP